MPHDSRARSPRSPCHPIQRIRCSCCGRSWAVYEGKIPRLWNVLGSEVFCDRRPCNAALCQARKAAKA